MKRVLLKPKSKCKMVKCQMCKMQNGEMPDGKMPNVVKCLTFHMKANGSRASARILSKPIWPPIFGLRKIWTFSVFFLDNLLSSLMASSQWHFAVKLRSKFCAISSCPKILLRPEVTMKELFSRLFIYSNMTFQVWNTTTTCIFENFFNTKVT